MSGELAQSVIGAMEYDYAQKNAALDYYTLLSINNALPEDLANIGLWIGMPCPTASSSLISGNVFTLTGAASYPQYIPTIGFGTVSTPSVGGLFTSVTPTDITYIPIEKYRGLLKWYAIFKRDGFTIKAMDDLASLFSALYTITYVTSNTFTLAPGSTTTSSTLLGLAPDDLSTGGHFISGAAWDINLHFNETIGAGNVYVLQYIFDTILDAQKVNVSQAI